MNHMNLRRELRKVGAGEHEADQLNDVAKLLGNIKTKGLSKEAKKRLAPDISASKAPRPWFALALSGSFATACLLLIVAQSALPGSWLYKLKRTTEEARAVVQPGYKESLVEKREDEVEQLLLQKADPAVLEKAEKNFERSLQHYNDQKSQERYQPRYDWSRRWLENRSQDVRGETQGWQSPDPLRKASDKYR